MTPRDRRAKRGDDPTGCGHPRLPRIHKRVKTNGRGVLSPEEWSRVAESLGLSGRELEIVQGIFDDRKELAIAHDLKISTHTVHTHLGRLYRKLDVGSRTALVVRVLGEHLSLSSSHEATAE